MGKRGRPHLLLPLPPDRHSAMVIFRSIEEIVAQFKNPVVTIGNFDGIHLGHREIFSRVKQAAAEIGGVSMVITFKPHPLKLLSPDKSPRLINTYGEKELLIKASGVDYLLEIPFTHEIAAISATDFVREVLVERIGVKRLIIGYDYAFGRNREGNVELLRRCGRDYGFDVEVLQPVGAGGTVYSSSRVRAMIDSGDVKGVVSLLGRHFSVSGFVVHGFHRGKTLGFPTANLLTDKELIPGHGVYAVKVKVDDLLYDGACNIGENPTFGNGKTSIEVFLFDFEGDLYGREMRVYFIDKVRDERKFADAAALSEAIAQDVAKCREILQDTSLIDYRRYLEQV